MTTIHVQIIGDKAVLSQSEFEWLVELARQCEEIALQIHEDDVPTLGVMCLVEQGGAFEFWVEHGEDIYSPDDGACVTLPTLSRGDVVLTRFPFTEFDRRRHSGTLVQGEEHGR